MFINEKERMKFGVQMSCFSVKTYEKSPSFFEKQIMQGICQEKRRIYTYRGYAWHRWFESTFVFDRYIRCNTSKNIKISNNMEKIK